MYNVHTYIRICTSTNIYPGDRTRSQKHISEGTGMLGERGTVCGEEKKE